MTNIFVGNFDITATEQQLRELFAAHGAVETVTIVKDRDTCEPRGIAFVEMTQATEAGCYCCPRWEPAQWASDESQRSSSETSAEPKDLIPALEIIDDIRCELASAANSVLSNSEMDAS
jgi:hypothetical protein